MDANREGSTLGRKGELWVRRPAHQRPPKDGKSENVSPQSPFLHPGRALSQATYKAVMRAAVPARREAGPATLGATTYSCKVPDTCQFALGTDATAEGVSVQPLTGPPVLLPPPHGVLASWFFHCLLQGAVSWKRWVFNVNFHSSYALNQENELFVQPEPLQNKNGWCI